VKHLQFSSSIGHHAKFQCSVLSYYVDDVGLRRGTPKIGFLESYPLGWRCGRTLAVCAYPRCLTVPDLMAVDQKC